MKKTVGRITAPFAVFLFGCGFAAPVFSLEPANVRMGSLYLTPTLDLEQLYTDNLLRTSDQELDTWGTIFRPRVQAWAQHNLDTYSLTYQLEDGHYQDSSDDDYTNHLFRSDIHKEFYEPHALDLFAKYVNAYESRGTGLSEGEIANLIDEPFKYELTGFGGQYTLGNSKTRGRLELEVRTEDIQYKNIRDITRRYDRDQDSLRGTVYYRVGGRTDALAELRRVDTDYRVDPFQDGASLDSLDSDEYVYLVGASWEATGNTTGSVKIGTFDRKLDSDRNSDTGFHWEADVVWEPRTYATFELGTRRYSEETNGVGDYVKARDYDLSWDHDWSSRIHSRAFVLYGDDEYPSSARQDDRYEAEARLDYRFRLWCDFGVGYRYEKRASSIRSLDYTRNEVFIDVSLSL
jgi:hypothetical protein